MAKTSKAQRRDEEERRIVQRLCEQGRMFETPMWTESYLCFQMIGDVENDTLDLSIEREHPIFIAEAYDLISTLLSLE